MSVAHSRSIALVDCVSFYASCERVFEPALDGRPIIVLSNNDGCVVAASPEAKQVDPDIMGKPWFKIEAWTRMAGVARSSNYELYGSLSARVMNRRMLQRMQLFTLANDTYWHSPRRTASTITAWSRGCREPS